MWGLAHKCSAVFLSWIWNIHNSAVHISAPRVNIKSRGAEHNTCWNEITKVEVNDATVEKSCTLRKYVALIVNKKADWH